MREATVPHKLVNGVPSRVHALQTPVPGYQKLVVSDILGDVPVCTRGSREYLPGTYQHTLAINVLHGRKGKTPIQINQEQPGDNLCCSPDAGGAKTISILPYAKLSSKRRVSAPEELTRRT